jgi:predicted ATPase
MAIKRIEIQNFKSFCHQTIELGQFNVLIGANASGKSNFLQIFQFISDIAHHGLSNAISRQGGVKYLRNTNIAVQEPLVLKMVIDSNYSPEGLINPEATTIPEITYEFAIKFNKRGLGFKVVQDKLTYKHQNEPGKFIITHVNGTVKTKNTLGNIIPAFFQESLVSKSLKPQTLLLELPMFRLMLAELNQVDIFNHISIYDFDAKQSQKLSPIEGQINLAEDTHNLAIVLQYLFAHKPEKRQFLNLLTYVLPFVEDLRVVHSSTGDKLMIKLKETYSETYFPATLVSKGTLNAISLVIALSFEQKPLLLIEEPEKHFYPSLMAAIIELFKDSLEEKQIIMTTHNSQIVKLLGLEDILLIARDENGFSTVSKPVDFENVKILGQNLSAEFLYVQDLLGL